MSPGSIQWIGHEALMAALSWVEVVDALEDALVRGDAPGNTPPRAHVPVSAGELLLMPGQVGHDLGVKVVSVNDNSFSLGVPRIQGVHVAFDGTTLTPAAMLDARALTLLRTAGLSALAVRHLAPDSACSLLVFGTGPQAVSHAAAINAVRPLDEVVVVGRRPEAVADAVRRIGQIGPLVRSGTSEDVAVVDLIACCTSAERPLFDSSLLRAEATVVAIGSHSPMMREVDTELVRRATVVVETRASAINRAGDIVLALADGLTEDTAISGDLRAMVSGVVIPALGAPRLFKSVGEAWTDVVVASAAVRATLTPAPT